MEICLICGIELHSKCTLTKHLKKVHDLTSTEYTKSHILGGIIPKCNV